MGKNKLCRLLGLLLALVLMAVTVISPVSAAEAELTGSGVEEEYAGSAAGVDTAVNEDSEEFDGIDVAESIADDFYENEGEEVTDDAAVILLVPYEQVPLYQFTLASETMGLAVQLYLIPVKIQFLRYPFITPTLQSEGVDKLFLFLFHPCASLQSASLVLCPFLEKATDFITFPYGF